MRFPAALLVAAALGPAGAVPAHALPVVDVSWNDCTPIVVNHDMAGPGLYTIDFSATGLSGTYASFAFGAKFAPMIVPEAWAFYANDFWSGVPGCQGPARLTPSTSGSSCPAYPPDATFVPFVTMGQGSLTSPAPTTLFGLFPFNRAFVADPATRYSLGRVVFDHSASVPGIAGPGDCGGFDVAMCAVFQGTITLFVANNTFPVTATFDHSYLGWQDASNTRGCPGATPASATTWGSIKAQYR